MKKNLILLALLVATILAWLLWPRPKVGAVIPNGPSPESASAPVPDSQLSTLSSLSRHSSAGATADQLSSAPIPFPLNAPTQDIATDLRLLADVFESFRTNFPHSGNPVGDNADITAALTGKNPLHVTLIPSDHPAINTRGELCDRWGTPFFFHQLSGTQMEIRSAGPDRKLRTIDDIVLTP